MQNLSIFFNILICRLFWDGVIKKGREWNKLKKKDPRGQVFRAGSVMSLEGIRNWTVQVLSDQS